MTLFEPSEARIKVAAMMEEYPELEVEFAKIDAEETELKR